MSKSKIENRLNTMRHKQAQPTDSLILAESAEGKDFSQELSKAQPFDEIPSLTEKQVAFGMCNPQAHLDAKQEKLERFKKKRAEKKLARAIDKSSFPNPTEDYDARSVAAPNNPSFEELLEIGMKLQNQPAPPSPEEPIVKKGPKTQSLVGMTRELQKKVSIISYHGALYFFNGRYYEYLDTDRLLMLYREYVDYDLNHESSLYGHKDLYQCCATDPEIQREEPKGEPIYAPLKNGIFVLGEEKLYPHSPNQLTFTCIKAKYDPQAKCPVFDRFLWQITHGNPQLLERFWMAIGYLFIYPARGKFFILMGYARDSGKSVLGNFIQRLYPKESVSNLRLSEMKGTFALMPLLSSVINFELDMPNTKLNAEAISRLKQITGGDSIDVQRKYLSSVVLTRRIKFVFASNHPPCIEGEDDALLKRIVYLPFDTSIPDDQQDPDLEEKIWKERNVDQGITGTQAQKRPEFLRMMEDARKGKFDLIITREVSRFARNTVDALSYTRELKAMGVNVFFINDGINTATNDGELRLTIMSSMAQDESRKISERVKAGQRISREKHVLYGSGNILGYRRENGTYIPDPDQVETVRLIFQMYSDGEKGLTQIVNELYRLGRLDAGGHVSWDASKVSRVLHNATYKGCICYNKSHSDGYLTQKRVKNLDESSYIYVKGDFEPLVSEEMWDRCQQILLSRSARVIDENGKKHKYMRNRAERRSIPVHR